MLKQEIVREATRLTRAIRLVEATALLQSMLRGETAPGMTFGADGDIALTRRGPLIIDAKANTIEETDRPHLVRATSAPPRRFRAFLDHTKEHSVLGLRGVINRAPLSKPDIVPEGARFIEGTYSNPAGSRAYKALHRQPVSGQRLPLVIMLHGCTQSPDDFTAGTRMNFIVEEQTCLVSIPHSPATQTVRTAGTGFEQPTSSGTEVNLRLSRASRARSCVNIRSIQSAFTSVDCRPERPRLLWEPTTICTLQSAYILASPVGPPQTFRRRLSPCDKVVGPMTR